LIRNRGRIGGTGRDNIREWHLHPPENPTEHVEIEALYSSEIVERSRTVLKDWADQMPIEESGPKGGKRARSEVGYEPDGYLILSKGN
jgi:hypothetical protein